MDLNPIKDIHSLFRKSIAIEENKKSEAQWFFDDYNHDYDFDQFGDYELPLLITMQNTVECCKMYTCNENAGRIVFLY